MSVEAWTLGGAAGGAALGGFAAAAAHREGAEVGQAATVGAGVGALEMGSAAWLGSRNVNPYLVGAGEALGMGLLTYAAYASAHERYSWGEAILGYLVTAGVTTLAAWTNRPQSAPPVYKPPGPYIAPQVAPRVAYPAVPAQHTVPSAAISQQPGTVA
jgi:hypothetical protein